MFPVPFGEIHDICIIHSILYISGNLYTTQNVLIRINFNNKATSHTFSSHSMVRIATVGTNSGHK